MKIRCYHTENLQCSLWSVILMLQWNESGVSQGSASALAGGEIIRSQIDSLSKGAVSWIRKTIWLIEEGHAREITNLKKGTCLTKVLKVDFPWVITSWSIFHACFEILWSELLQCWALISASSAAVTCAKVLCTIAKWPEEQGPWPLKLVRQDLQAEIVYHENNQCN